MKTAAFVPVKLNNERMPGKNLKRFFDGTPLLSFILNTLLEIPEIDERYLFCSSDEVRPYLPEGITFLKRPQYLDTAEATPQDIMREFISRVPADIYITAHATSPFVSAGHIRECILQVRSGVYDSAFTARKLQKLLWKNGAPLNFQADHIPRTQDLEPIYSEVSAAYVYQRQVFQERNRRIGVHPYICEVSEVEAIDIDTGEDFLIADAIYRGIVSKRREPVCDM